LRQRLSKNRPFKQSRSSKKSFTPYTICIPGSFHYSKIKLPMLHLTFIDVTWVVSYEVLCVRHPAGVQTPKLFIPNRQSSRSNRSTKLFNFFFDFFKICFANAFYQIINRRKFSHQDRISILLHLGWSAC